jgi:CRISPR/Cas system Type II protein with McrA/HNH and RuvC-like nuclease domain
MKDEILKLKNDGMTMSDIARTLNISRERVRYYIDPNRRNVVLKSQSKFNEKNRLCKKVANFHVTTENKVGRNFRYKEFLDRIGANPICYITKEPIDLNDHASYSIDHILPSSKGGTNSIENAGLIKSDVNRMKQDKTPDEFFSMCKRVLESNGYTVTENAGNS